MASIITILKRAIQILCIGTVLGICAVVLILAPGYLDEYQRVNKSHIISQVIGPIGGSISAQTIEEAWQEALRVGHGDPSWQCPVKPDNVILVPSSLEIGNNRYYGISVSRLEFINGQMTLRETIEIHLQPKESCFIRHVLVHELLHAVALRRNLTDPEFSKKMKKYNGDEGWVRFVWPAIDILSTRCP